MNRFLVVDDDHVSLAIIENALSSPECSVTACVSAVEALKAFDRGDFDLVLSDYFMPEMNGDEFLNAVRARSEEIAFVFLTANTDIEIATALVKSGADDYLMKPVVPDELLFRIRRIQREKEQERILRQVEHEKQLLERENRTLTNWRLLYAGKDIAQTEQMISLLSRTINQSGGFLWLDLMESGSERLPDGSHRIGGDLYSMILSAARSQKEVFDFITYVGTIDELELSRETVPVSQFVEEMTQFVRGEFPKLTEEHPRTVGVSTARGCPDGTLRVDRGLMREIVRELLVNAVKFSPAESRVVVEMERSRGVSPDNIDIVVTNEAVACSQTDTEGRPIVGIPYDYSELVFDMFYTIESFPAYLSGERWRDGTGLFIARKLLKRMGGWIKAANGVDYTGRTPRTIVKLTVTLPVLPPE